VVSGRLADRAAVRVAGLILIAVLRPRLRDVRPALVFWGALGYGGCIASRTWV
jgi:hypothetical protein